MYIKVGVFFALCVIVKFDYVVNSVAGDHKTSTGVAETEDPHSTKTPTPVKTVSTSLAKPTNKTSTTTTLTTTPKSQQKTTPSTTPSTTPKIIATTPTTTPTTRFTSAPTTTTPIITTTTPPTTTTTPPKTTTTLPTTTTTQSTTSTTTTAPPTTATQTTITTAPSTAAPILSSTSPALTTSSYTVTDTSPVSTSPSSSSSSWISSTYITKTTESMTTIAFTNATTISNSDTEPTPATVFALFLSVICVVVVGGLIGFLLWKRRQESYVPCTMRSCKGWFAKRKRSPSSSSQGPLTTDDTASIDMTEPRQERELFSIGDQDGGSDGRPKTRSRRGTEDDYFYDEIFERSAFVDERTNKSNQRLTIESEDDDELDIPDLIFKRPTEKY